MFWLNIHDCISLQTVFMDFVFVKVSIIYYIKFQMFKMKQ